jgi:GNAT superfamily N-acetyltransferase
VIKAHENKIRQARPGDETTIIGLLHDLSEYQGSLHRFFVAPDNVQRDYFCVPPRVQCSLLFRDGVPCGIATWFWGYHRGKTARTLYIENFFVLPDFRGRGVGRALLQYMAKLALKGCAETIELFVYDWNELAIGFYQKCELKRIEDLCHWRLEEDAMHAVAGATSLTDVQISLVKLQDEAVMDFLLEALVAQGMDGAPPLRDKVRNCQTCNRPELHVEIAAIDGEIVGILTWYWTYSGFAARRALHCDTIFVQPSRRRNRVGTGLMAHLSRTGVEGNALRIDWNTSVKAMSAVCYCESIDALPLSGASYFELEHAGLCQLAGNG